MSEFQIVSLISLFGFLILAASALSARHLSVRKSVVMALGWAAIFAVVILFISLVYA